MTSGFGMVAQYLKPIPRGYTSLAVEELMLAGFEDHTSPLPPATTNLIE